MNIETARRDASAILASLARRLDETKRIAECESLAERAQKRLERVRKIVQRIIDERLLERPGRQRFALHEREAIQNLLNALIFETDAGIESRVSACRKRIAELPNQKECG